MKTLTTLIAALTLAGCATYIPAEIAVSRVDEEDVAVQVIRNSAEGSLKDLASPEAERMCAKFGRTSEYVSHRTAGQIAKAGLFGPSHVSYHEVLFICVP